MSLNPRYAIYSLLFVFATNAFAANAGSVSATCPYQTGCASIVADGGSYCRIDDERKIASREIKQKTDIKFQTNVDVPMLILGSDGKSPHCVSSTQLPSSFTTKMSIKRYPDGSFLLHADNIGYVALGRRSNSASTVHWLQGHKIIGLEELEVVVYLLDEPQGGATILKHYRLEIFTKDCLSHLPQENVNFGQKDTNRFTCTDATTKRGLVLPQESNSGDGYEPKK